MSVVSEIVKGVGPMKTEIRAPGGVRHQLCRYGLSKLRFRGPRRPTDGRYIAFLGGSETFARYVDKPFPALIEAAIGEVCVNLGCRSAGPDIFLRDSALHSLCHDAAARVVQLCGAVNLTNRYYKVHPRRNDRFIAPSTALRALYPEVDFSEIAFTGHLINRLRGTCETRFAQVRSMLQATWVERMKWLVKQPGGPVILLWFGSRSLDSESAGVNPANHSVFVTRAMVESLRPHVADIVEIVGLRGDVAGMNFDSLDRANAMDMLGLAAHDAAARALRVPLLHAMT